MKLNVKKFGLALGLTGVILYISCILLMLIIGQARIVKFFNSLLHGLDVSSIIRIEVPLWEAAIGIVETFILGWLIGACIATIYNTLVK
ncbi:DUF5676 family membrane protein [Tenacibaculum sp.]|uniref:DUF5676 family membrane protein n=1 Tax=Tenacibaculum sp. TaxID=1906242 RepID=UPI003D0D8513